MVTTGGVVVSTGGFVVSTGGFVVSTGGSVVSTGGSVVSTGGVGVEVSFEFSNFTVNVTAFVSLSTIPFPKSTSTGSCAFQPFAFTSIIWYFTPVGSPKMVTDCLWWR